MSLKIIGVGFGRTGTLSTQSALNQIGYNCYHMNEVMHNPNLSHLNFWLKVAKAPKKTQHDWDKAFDGYNATVDYPGSCVWEELVESYPEAKVILTLHPKGPEAWYNSTFNTIYRVQKMWEGKIVALFSSRTRKIIRMTAKLIWKNFLNGTMENKQDAIDRYNEHIENVKKQIPADRLLIYSVDQGWEPLCNFLRKEVPKTSFPKVNDTLEMKQNIKSRSKIAKKIIALAIIVGLALIWLIV
jgi:hypothetical protein